MPPDAAGPWEPLRAGSDEPGPREEFASARRAASELRVAPPRKRRGALEAAPLSVGRRQAHGLRESPAIASRSARCSASSAAVGTVDDAEGASDGTGSAIHRCGGDDGETQLQTPASRRQGRDANRDTERAGGPHVAGAGLVPRRERHHRRTGLAGDLLSHEYDAVNQILDLGIPRSATASGGIYFFKDGREVPDVFQVVYEHPERELTLVYSATLGNGRARGKVLMGHDASMEVGNNVRVLVDSGSTRYKDWLKQEVVDTEHPMLSYRPGYKGVDAVTSATEEYFASRGLLFTYQGGRRVSTLRLHVKEWLDCIRHGGTPSCGIERGVEEAITCHMATESYRRGRKVEWDSLRSRIVC